MKVTTPSTTRLTNLEHFQLMTDTRDIVFPVPGQHGAPVPGTLQAPVSVLEPFRAKFIELYDREDVALLKIMKDEATETLNIAERVRDEAVTGLRFYVRAFAYSLDSAKRESARKLQIVFDAFGEFQRLGNTKQTSAAYNFVQSMKERAEDVTTIGADEWVEAVQQTNEDFARLASQRLDERTEKATEDVKVVRTEIDAVFNQMMSYLDITSTLSPAQQLTDLIDRLNQLMATYRNILAQRQGVAKAKKAKGTPEIITGETPNP